MTSLRKYVNPSEPVVVHEHTNHRFAVFCAARDDSVAHGATTNNTAAMTKNTSRVLDAWDSMLPPMST
jgi:hypothetical protein